MNKDLQDALDALRNLAETPTTNGALRGLTATVDTLQPQARFLGPYVTVCNNWNMFWTFNAEHFTAPDSTGGSERALLNNGYGDPDNGIARMGANEFVHGATASNPCPRPERRRPAVPPQQPIGGCGHRQPGASGLLQRPAAATSTSRNCFRPARLRGLRAREVDAEMVDDPYRRWPALPDLRPPRSRPWHLRGTRAAW